MSSSQILLINYTWKSAHLSVSIPIKAESLAVFCCVVFSCVFKKKHQAVKILAITLKNQLLLPNSMEQSHHTILQWEPVKLSPKQVKVTSSSPTDQTAQYSEIAKTQEQNITLYRCQFDCENKSLWQNYLEKPEQSWFIWKSVNNKKRPNTM